MDSLLKLEDPEYLSHQTLPALLNNFQMHIVYVLRSFKDGKFYTGYTKNLNQRIEAHNAGKILSTKYRRPLELIYFEASINQNDALKREKYLKTTYGKRYIKNRVNHYLLSINS